MADRGRRSALRYWNAIASDARSKDQAVPVKLTKWITSHPSRSVAHGGTTRTFAPHVLGVIKCATRSGPSLRREYGENIMRARPVSSRETVIHPDEESVVLLIKRSEPVREGRQAKK
jgi:hypothetical protein